MTPEDRNEFTDWHEEKVKSGTVFRFRKELEEYCRSDVDILRRACGKFRSLFIELCQFDPFTEAVTISQAAVKIWPKDFMPTETVAIIPAQGYPNEKKFSIKGVRWVQSMAIKTGRRIQHALNGGEQKVEGVYVDGYDRCNMSY